ncbi:MAG: serine/threonine-protein kinase, partial [Planctomycetota bacterium]
MSSNSIRPDKDPRSTDAARFDETIAQDRSGDSNTDGDFVVAEVPRSIGRFRIERLLGTGGMGSVYLAHDDQLDRSVALKVPKFQSGVQSNAIERFYREARAAARLSHPNLCPVYDVGVDEDTHYIAMGYIAGKTLSEHISLQDGLAPKVAATIVRKVALAMHEAHQSGVVHRDLKPANIMIDQRKEPIVMDFGLACPHSDDVENTRLTQDGALLGSPAYMAPEQLRGEIDEIGPTTDVYALGVVLYESMAGKLPFPDTKSTFALVSRVLTEKAPEITSICEDVPPALGAICEKAMAKSSADRFPSMKAMADALGAYIKGTSNADRVPESAKATRAVDKKDVTRIQLNEQGKLAKSLCQSGQFEAALPILQQMVANSDAQETNAVRWAKQTLPQVKKRVQDAAGEFSSIPAPVATKPAVPYRGNLAAKAAKAREAREFRKRVAWVAGGGAGLVLLVALVGMAVMNHLATSESDETVAVAEPVVTPAERAEATVSMAAEEASVSQPGPALSATERSRRGAGSKRLIAASRVFATLDGNRDDLLDR